MSTQKKVLGAYDRHATRVWESGYRFHPQYMAAKALTDWKLLSAVDLTGRTVLNVGCCEPIDEMQFVEKVIRWVGVDLSPSMVTVAREIVACKLHPNLQPRIEFMVADATQLPFATATFDVVCAFSTIDHIPTPAERQKALEEMARVTRPGGHVVVTVPNRWNRYYDRTVRRMMAEGTSDFGFEYRYSPPELRRALSGTGMVVEEFASSLSMINPVYHAGLEGRLYRLLAPLGARIGYRCRKP